MYNLGPQFRIDQEKLKVNEKCVFTGNKYRIEVLSERLIRIEYSETGKFVDLASNLVICRNFERPMFEHKEDEAFIYINTKYINFRYLKNTKFSEKSLSATINYSKKEWFYTQKEVKNYGGTTVSLDNTTKLPNLEKGLFNPDMYLILDDSNTLLFSI